MKNIKEVSDKSKMFLFPGLTEQNEAQKITSPSPHLHKSFNLVPPPPRFSPPESELGHGAENGHWWEPPAPWPDLRGLGGGG